jgi:hypothetical protein
VPLDAHIIEPVTGKIDPELKAHLGVDEHGVLFAHPEFQSGHFPLLARIRDYYSDADYANDELQALIAELERVGVLFDPGSGISHFLGPFHSLCCLAFVRQKDVALYAD